MKLKKALGLTVNRSEYNRLYKRYLEKTGLIKCDRCMYNKGENSNRMGNSWKRHRKYQARDRV